MTITQLLTLRRSQEASARQKLSDNLSASVIAMRACDYAECDRLYQERKTIRRVIELTAAPIYAPDFAANDLEDVA